MAASSDNLLSISVLASPRPQLALDLFKAIRERGGYELMPEWETKPANRYLPKRKVSV